MYRGFRSKEAAVSATAPTSAPATRQSTSSELYWVHLFVSFFLGLPLVDFVTGLLSPGTIGPEEAITLWNVFLATAPLCLALGGITYLIQSGAIKGFAQIGVASSATLFAATWLGMELGFDVPGGYTEIGGGPFGPALTFLVGYHQLYGPALFLSAFVIGPYLGWKAHQTFGEPVKA
jgi:hypothetical protein